MISQLSLSATTIKIMSADVIISGLTMASNLTSNSTTPDTNDLGLGGMLLRFGAAEREVFFKLFWAYGVVFIALFTCSWITLWKFLNFRLDRVDMFLVNGGYLGTTKKATENEFSHGRRVYWITRIVQCALLLPLIVLLVWGSAVVRAIPTAPMMGVGMLTLWVAFFLGLYAFNVWKRNGWSFIIRGSTVLVKTLMILPVCLVLLFELLAVLLDPLFSFTGISWAFMTINLIPMIVLAHANDPALQLTSADWNANSRISVGSHVRQTNEKSSEYGSRRFNAACYCAAVLSLLAYIIVFISAGNKQGAQTTVAIAVACSTIILDLVTYLLWHGQHLINPVRIFLVMIFGRACLISFGHTYWFIGQSTMYLVFGLVISKSLVDDIMNKRLEKMERDKKYAAIAASIPADASDTPGPGMEAGQGISSKLSSVASLGNQNNVCVEKLSRSHVVLTLMTACFVLLLVIVAIISDKEMKKIKLVEMEHEQWAFGIASLYLVFVFTFGYFTIRNSRLEAVMDDDCHSMLSFKAQTLVFMAIFYVGTVAGAIFLYMITKAQEILLTAICLPVIISSLLVWNEHYRELDFNAVSPRSKRKHKAKTLEEINARAEAIRKAKEDEAKRIAEADERGEERPKPVPRELTEDDDEYWDVDYNKKVGCCGGWSSGVPLYEKEKGCCSIFQNWFKGDFRKANIAVALFRGGLPKKDYTMLALIMLAGLFAVIWGMGIWSLETSKIPYIRGIGPTITFITVLLFATWVPIYTWFNKLQINRFMITMFVIAAGMHVGFHLYLWQNMQSGELSLASLGTLFSFLLYPTLVLLATAVYKWLDDNYEVTSFVTGCVVGTQITTLAFEIAVTVVYSNTAGIIMLVIHGVCLFLGYSAVKWVRNNNHLSKIHRGAIVIVFAVVVAAGSLFGVAGSGYSAFYAFTASWYTLFFFLAGTSFAILYPPFKEDRLVFSETVFPVFVWDKSSGKVRIAYMGISLAYLALLAVMLWGVVTTIFVTPVYLGMGFASISITCLVCMTMSLSHIPHRKFAEAILTIKRQDEFEASMQGTHRDSLAGVLNEAHRIALHQIESVEPEVQEDNDDVLEAGQTPSVDEGPKHSKTLEAAALMASSSKHQERVHALEKNLLHFYSQRFVCACRPVNGPNESAQSAPTENPVSSAGEGWGDASATLPVDDAWGAAESGGGNWSGSPSDLVALARELLDVDKDLTHTFYEDQSVSCLYRALVQMSATSRLQESEAGFSAFLGWCRSTGVQQLLVSAGVDNVFGAAAQRNQAAGTSPKITLSTVFSWASKEREKFKAFQKLSRAFRKQKEKEREEIARKEAIEKAAEERRQELLRKAEEQRRKEEAERWRRQNEAEAKRMEEDRKRRDEEIRRRHEEDVRRREEEERRRQEEEERQLILAGLAEAERKRQEEERRRAEEEERRVREEEERRLAQEQANETERERKRKEMEERRRKRAEERRRKEQEALRKAEEERKRQEEERRNQVGSGGNSGQSAAEIARNKKRAEIEARRRKRQLQNIRGKQSAEADLRRDLKRNEEDMIALQAAAAAGNGLTEEQRLKRDFELDSEGFYVDKRWKNPKHACRIDKNRKAEDRIEREGMVWARPEKFMDNPQLVCVNEEDSDQGGFGSNDVCQGALGDCWLLAAMTVVALHPEYMEKVMDRKGNIERQKKGYFAVNIFTAGRFEQVLVDSTILCTKTGNQRKPFRPMFVTARDKNELWPMILEKAYARHHDSFEAINGGFVHKGLMDFTGGFGTDIDLQECQVDINSGALFKKLLGYKASGFLMGAGSPSGSDSDTSTTGIVQGHAYAILNIVEESDSNGTHQLLCLRNPWGQSEWNGAWSDNDRARWTTRMKQKLNFTSEDDGKFWMSFQDFTQNYARVYLCKTFKLKKDGGSFYYTKNTAFWKNADKTAGGAPTSKNKNCHRNPSFIIKPSRPCTIYVSVQQYGLNGHSESDQYQAAFLLKKRGKRVKGLYRGDKIASSGSFTNVHMATFEAKIEPYDRGYTLYCAAYKEGVEAQLSVRVYSDAPLLDVDYDVDEPKLYELPLSAPIDNGRD